MFIQTSSQASLASPGTDKRSANRLSGGHADRTNRPRCVTGSGAVTARQAGADNRRSLCALFASVPRTTTKTEKRLAGGGGGGAGRTWGRWACARLLGCSARKYSGAVSCAFPRIMESRMLRPVLLLVLFLISLPSAAAASTCASLIRKAANVRRRCAALARSDLWKGVAKPTLCEEPDHAPRLTHKTFGPSERTGLMNGTEIQA